MPKSPSRYWGDLSTADFATIDPAKTIGVLPVAATEQHGPHLPLCVDAAISAGILDRAIAIMPQDLAVLILPAMQVGSSDEHAAFPGTLSFSATTVVRIWTELGECVHRAGIRKLLIFNSHGGQSQLMEFVAVDLRRRFGMLAAWASWPGFGYPDGLFSEDEIAYGIHGGAIETSAMLHLRPDLVREGEQANFQSTAANMARDYRYLSPGRRIGFGWQTQDLNPAGAVGNAAEAAAEHGRMVVDHAAQGLVALLQDMARFPLETLKS